MISTREGQKILHECKESKSFKSDKFWHKVKIVLCNVLLCLMFRHKIIHAVCTFNCGPPTHWVFNLRCEGMPWKTALTPDTITSILNKCTLRTRSFDCFGTKAGCVVTLLVSAQSLIVDSIVATSSMASALVKRHLRAQQSLQVVVRSISTNNNPILTDHAHPKESIMNFSDFQKAYSVCESRTAVHMSAPAAPLVHSPSLSSSFCELTLS